MNFFKDDEAKNFRGTPHVTRVAYHPAEITHLDALNQCIKESEGGSAFITSPEPGLHYLCIRKPDGVSNVLPEVIHMDSIVCLLNETKNSRDWAPYCPFTLSIRSPIHLYEFMRGDFSLAVAVNKAELIKQFALNKIQAVMPSSGNWAVWMRSIGNDGASAVSQQMFGRLFFEFQSLAWFVAANSDQNRKIEGDLEEQVTLLASAEKTPTIGWTAALPDWIQRVFDAPDANIK